MMKRWEVMCRRGFSFGSRCWKMLSENVIWALKQQLHMNTYNHFISSTSPQVMKKDKCMLQSVLRLIELWLIKKWLDFTDWKWTEKSRKIDTIIFTACCCIVQYEIWIKTGLKDDKSQPCSDVSLQSPLRHTDQTQISFKHSASGLNDNSLTFCL